MKMMLMAVVLVLGTGCMGGLAKVAKELAKDPATASLRVRLPTPYGMGEFDLARSGATNIAATAGGGAVSVGAKKAGVPGE